MANTYNEHNGTGSQDTFAYTFPYLKTTDVKVSVDGVVKQLTTDYTRPSVTTIQFNSDKKPANGAKVRIYRDTDESSANATFYAGSAIKSQDLNDNFLQAIYIGEEGKEAGDDAWNKLEDSVDSTETWVSNNTTISTTGAIDARVDSKIDTALTTDVVGGDRITVTDNSPGSGQITIKVTPDSIVNSDINSSAAIAGSKVNPAFGSQNISTSGTLASGAATVTGNIAVSGTVDGRDIAADGTKLDGIESSATADQTAAEIRTLVESASDSNVFTDADHSKLNAIENNATADQTVSEIKTLIASSPLDASHLAANSVTTSEIAADSVTTTKIGTDAVTGAKIANDAIGSEHIEVLDANLQLADNAKIQIGTGNDFEIYHDGTHTYLKDTTDPGIVYFDVSGLEIREADGVKVVAGFDGTDGGVQLYFNNSQKIQTTNTGATVTGVLEVSGGLGDNTVPTSAIADAELTTLAGMQSGTASILADSTALTSTTAELNLLDGKSIVTTVSGSSTDVQLPTAKAVNDQIVNTISDVGGFVPVANEVSFPNTNPDPGNNAGTIVSIADAGGIVVNGSGVSTTGRTLGGATVTINGIDSALYNTTIAAGKGMLVQTTSTLNTYDYHRLVVDEAGVASAQTLVSDFNNRYRIASSAPSSSLDDGDLWFDTTNNKMKVYNASGTSWDDVASSGDFYINTLSSSGNTGGGSATFNGSAYRFVLSNPPGTAQQLIVSINGVIQKPNSGTSQPSEGFAISGNDIIFAAAPATNSDYFIVTIGNTVSIGTPSDNTVSTAKIQNLAVTGDKIATNLDLADNKKIRFGTGNDLELYHDGTDSKIFNHTGTFKINSNDFLFKDKNEHDTFAKFIHDGAVELYYDGVKKLETHSGGCIFTGNLYGLDNHQIQLGNSNDFKIYHDATDSIIKNDTNKLRILSDEIHINNNADGENLAKLTANGAVELYYDDSKKFETYSSGVEWHGNLKNESDGDNNGIYLGASNDLGIYHDGNHSYIKDTGTGNLKIDGSDNVELQAGGSTKAYTYANGLFVYDQQIPDDGVLNIGNGSDLKIYHNGSASYIKQDGTGDLFIRDGSSDRIRSRSAGEVQLCYDDSVKLETTSTGVKNDGILELAESATTKGKLQAKAITNVSTTWTDVVTTGIGGLAFITAYNTSGGNQMSALVMWRVGSHTVISEDDNTGCGVDYQANGAVLQIKTTSGTITGSAICMTV